MCAAVKSVAALLLSAYFLNDWPAHVLNKHKVFSSYIWRPVQHPAQFVVSALSWWKDIYYVYKAERRRSGGGRSILIWLKQHYITLKRRQSDEAEDERMCEPLLLNKPSLMLLAFKSSLLVCAVRINKIKRMKNIHLMRPSRKRDAEAHPICSSLVVLLPASGWHLCRWGPRSRRTWWPL